MKDSMKELNEENEEKYAGNIFCFVFNMNNNVSAGAH